MKKISCDVHVTEKFYCFGLSGLFVPVEKFPHNINTLNYFPEHNGRTFDCDRVKNTAAVPFVVKLISMT